MTAKTAQTPEPNDAAVPPAGLWRRLWRDYLKADRARIAGAIALLIGVAAGNAALPPVIAWAVDALNPQDAGVLFYAPFIVIPVMGAKALCGFFGAGLIEGAAQNVILRLRRDLFAHLTAADLARLSNDRAGALASRFVADMGVLREAVARAVRNLAVDLFSTIGLVAGMVFLNAQLALVALAALALGGGPVILIGRTLRRISGDVQQQTGDMSAFLTESFASARLVKTYALEDRQARAAQGAFEGLRRSQMRAAWARARVEPVMEFLGAIAVCAVLALAAFMVLERRAAIGDFAGFIAAVLLLAQHARRLGTLNGVIEEGRAALERIFAVLDDGQAVTEREGARVLRDVKGAVEFRDVTFRYPDGAKALDGVSLHAAPGETVAFVGPSGAGKSTLFNLIARLYDVDAGAVLIDGHDVRETTLASLRAATALVAQDVALLHDTIAANIAFGDPDADAAAIRAAAAAAAAVFIEDLPEGYDTLVGERGLRLSGGQRQRLALARALLKDAPILLLDEATSALDAESERLIQEVLDRTRGARTTLVIAHRLSTVRSADRIYVLDEGRVAEEGRHESLLQKGGLYANLAGRALRDDGPSSFAP